MNERELEELFRDAARAAPPASFDEQDIARGARRVTARRRMATTGGSLAAAAILVGGIGAGTGMFTPDRSTQAGPTPQTTQQPSQGQSPRAGGNGPTVLGGPLAGQDGCGPPDRELADALAQQLPEATRATAPVAATSCPEGSRTASFQVRQGEAAGNITVLLVPADSVPPGQSDSGEHLRPDGTRQVTDEADGGRILMVRSNPDSGASAAPYADRLSAIADRLADHF